MTKLFAILTTALAAASFLATAQSGRAAATGGRATATVRVGGKTFAFRDVRCELDSGYLTVRLGTIDLTVGRLSAAGRALATSAGAAISGTRVARTYAIGRARVRFAGGRARGSFIGRLVLSTRTVSGAFAC